MKLVHVLSAFWFIGGLLGRTVAYRQARRASELHDLTVFVQVGIRFERRMVRPGSVAMLFIGLLTAFLQGWPVHGGLYGSPVNWLFASVVLYLSAGLLIPLVFLPRGKRFRTALTDACVRGHITPGLTAALEDKMVIAARAYEWVVVVLIVVLMVAKPF